jgi:protease-4
LYPNKPVYSVVEDICTSGAYLIASAGDKIYSDKSSIVGSIGVISSSFGFVDILKKIGIERRLYKMGKYKGILDPFSDVTEEEKNIINNNLGLIYDNFQRTIKKNRKNIDPKNENEIYSGKFWIASEAINLGLVDGFYDVNTLCHDVIKNKRIVDYNSEFSILDLFIKFISKLSIT